MPLDFIVTPERVIDARVRPGAPSRSDASIRWADLTDEKINAIPLLRALRDSRD